MGSEPECERGREGPFSNDDASRGVSASPPRGRRYLSLKGRRTFQRVYRGGDRRSRGGVVVIVAPGAPGPPRVGVVAGKRQVGGAVQRTRAKRRLREACARMRLREGHDYIVVGSREVLQAPFDTLQEWLRQAIGGEE